MLLTDGVMGWKGSQQIHCAVSALTELNVARSEVLHYVGAGGGGESHTHNHIN